MSKSRPTLSLSVNSRQLRIRDSPESKEDAEASPQGGNASGTDIPSSPEGQDRDNVDMGADESSEGKYSFGIDGSPSPQSQHSFGIDSLSFPEDMDDFGAIAPLSRQVQDQGTENTLPKMDGMLVLETQESGITSRTAPQENIGEDFSRPVEADTLIGNPLTAQEDIRMDVPPSTEAKGLGDRLAAHSTFQLL